jgi:hypothetical protein
MRWVQAGIALLLLPVSAAQAQTQESELEAAEAVLDASSSDSGSPAAAETTTTATDTETKVDPALFEISWSTWVTASGNEPETNLQLDDEGWRVEDLLKPRRHKFYPSTSVSLYTEIPATDWLLFRGLIDTREIRDGSTLEPPLDGVTMGGNPAGQELRSGNIVREMSARLGSGAVKVELGRFRADVAEGLVYKDFGGGVRVRADLDELDVAPIQAELLLTTVGQRVEDLQSNQLLALRADWMLSPFEYIGFFIAGAKDQNGEISEVLRSAYAETLIPDQQKLDALFLQEQGSGGQGYLGALLQVLTADSAVMRARVVLSGGKLKLSVPLEEILTPEQVLEGREIEVDASGLAADIELRFGLSNDLELAGYGFLLSGDEPPQADGARYRSFIGLAPYWVWTGLFFTGGLAQGLYPNRATAAGVNGRGVVGVGPSLLYTHHPLRSEARAFVLSAAADPPAPPLGGTSRFYGAEIDWLGEWEALPWLSIGSELDVFIPGSFFTSRRVAYLALGVVTLSNAR